MQQSDDRARFEQVDWKEISAGRRVVTPERLALVGGLVAVCLLFAYDRTLADAYLVGTWRARPIDWVFMLGLVVLVAYGVVPAVQNRTAVDRVLSYLRSSIPALLSVLFLLGFVVVGLVGPIVLPELELRFDLAFQPPAFASTQVHPADCFGRTSGSVFEEVCHGSIKFPLGTSVRGHPVSYLLVEGARVALYIAVITAAFVVPLAVGVGTVAGVFGGRLDDLLMSYVDAQLSIPAIMLYFIGYAYSGPSLLLLLGTFGLLSWGGVARLVRSETLQRRENGHVVVVRSLGASKRYIARKHILPNITSTLVPSVFQLLALLILVEAGVAFLGFHELSFYSWGSTISESINAEVASQLQNRADVPAYKIWWVSTFPALLLTATLCALKLTGDALRDAIDPRRGGE